MNRVFPAAAVLAVAGSLILAGCDQQQQGGGMPPMGPVEVGVVTIQPQRVDLTSTLTGRVVPVRRAEIRPQVSGLITEVLFTQGALVKIGDPLFRIDDAPYKAAADAATAAVARAEAGLEIARLSERRYAELVRTSATSRQTYDDAIATRKQAEAEVASAKASLAAAEVDLKRTLIVSPINGRIGRSSVSQGALVRFDQTDYLAVVHQMDPIYVDVNQSSAELLRLKADMGKGTLADVDSGSAKVRLTLEDNSAYDQVGEMKLAEAVVSTSTGTVTLRTIFPNPQERLLPGMFVRAVVQVGVDEQGLLVPQRGITRSPTGDGTAMVVNAEGKVEPRKVTADRTVGDAWLVTAGISAGDRVIVDGLQKIQPGMPVVPVDAGATAANAAPPNAPPAAQ